MRQMARSGTWILLLAGIAAPVAQVAQAGRGPERAIMMELVFEGTGEQLSGIRLGEVKRLETVIQHRYGNPQWAPVYYEVFGILEDAREKSLVYASKLVDPRLVIQEPGGRPDKKPQSRWRNQAGTRVVIPDVREAELVVWKRNPGDPQNPRTELLRARP